ncbi:hypothetical protein DFH11DRAFT_1690240 [Phellopilus nigrolimitatus]|nr:hypothetical protein DFH11DRAFT_1690240 [Phellopilus nigrolimitatus]
MEPLTKRLHISGLTPQITPADLSARLSTFGTVNALDGYGKVDGLGQVRPYVYVTLETTKAQLAKCLNVLSGTTWKGARLRIGEAKPDFINRYDVVSFSLKFHFQLFFCSIRKENGPPSDTDRPKKRRRLARGCIGVHAADMSPVSPANAASRSGWRTTPLGRLVRPMRMRPLRPLPPQPAPLSGARKLAEAAALRKKKKKRDAAVLVRARRRMIDPEAWGSEYLKGVTLESTSGRTLPEKPARKMDPIAAFSASVQVEEPAATDQRKSLPPASPQPSTAQAASDLAAEASRDLSLLETLFGKDEGADWGGAESLSDVDLPAHAEAVGLGGGDDGIEYIPREEFLTKGEENVEDISDSEDTTMDSGEGQMPPSEMPEREGPAPQVHLKKLKDMFAPRAEDAAFSIFGNLDLDLELDDAFEAPVAPAPTPSAFPSAPHVPSLSAQSSHPMLASALDTNAPLFFPRSFSPGPSTRGAPKAPQDVFELLRSRLASADFDLRPAHSSNNQNQNQDGAGGGGFHRTQDAEAVRARWAARKLDLTRDWKRRHREAVKSARRRGSGKRD